jgi:capsular exopolysaccharide synthesis family protein
MPGPENSAGSTAADLHAYIRIVRHRKWTILACVALLVALTAAMTSRLTPEYTATARVSVKPVGPQAAYLNATPPDMNTERGIADSATVASLVQKQLGLPGSPDALLKNLNVSVENLTTILDISYTDPSPAQSEKITEAFADAYLYNRVQQAVVQASQQMAPIQSQMKTLSAQTAQLTQELNNNPNLSANRITSIGEQISFNNGRYGYLQQQLIPYQSTLTILCGQQDPGPQCDSHLNKQGGGSIVQPAVEPTAPSSPRWSVNLGLAIIVGLALGLGISFVRERLDEKLAGGKDLEDQVGAPLLAGVPHVAAWKRREATRLIVTEEPSGAISEAYRTMRTNLEYAGRDGNLRVLGVTSPLMGEGKTATAANLAATLAQTGKRVIAVSCDLRKPRLHRFFDLDNAVGVTSILTGQSSLAAAAQRPAGIESLRVLASGPVPDNPAELLGSDAMANLLSELRMFADYVVLDTPPVLMVSDASVLVPKADGVVVIADATSTHRGAVSRTREQLEQVGARIVGCVLNNVDPNKAKYYPSSYGYYQSYSYGQSHKGAGASNGETNGHKESEAATAEDMWK